MYTPLTQKLRTVISSGKVRFIARVTFGTIIVAVPMATITALLEAGVVVETANAEGFLSFIVLRVPDEGIAPG